jgi:hypothetical protein
MAAALAGHGYAAIIAARGKFGRPAWYPVIAVGLALFMFGSTGLVRGAHEASAFTSVRAHMEYLRAAENGDDRSFGAVLDVASKPNDPLLAWTLQTWPYLSYRRVAATRFIWKSFLAGEIWMGGTSSKYVLPHSWRWFAADVKQSRPAVFTVFDAALPASSPFTDYVNKDFTPVYDGNNPIYFRNDVAAAFLHAHPDGKWFAPAAPDPHSGWRVLSDRVTFDGPASTGNMLAMSNVACYELTGTLSAPSVVFQFSGADGTTLRRLSLRGDTATAGDLATEYSHNQSGTSTGHPTKFTLIVGKRAAAIVVGDRIRAAVELPARARTELGALESHLTLTNLHSDAAPAAAC